MSKFLKVIVGIILVVFIAAGAALIIPQFVGDVDTIIVQENMASNQRIGSVIYARKENSQDIQVGDKVVDMSPEHLYVHEVVSYDYATQTAQVTGSEAATVRIGDTFTRAMFTVPLIGYLTIATQSLPGLILLGLLLALIILMFASSEILRRHRPGDELDEDVFESKHEAEDDDFYGELAKKKRKTERIGTISDDLKDEPEPAAGLFREIPQETAPEKKKTAPIRTELDRPEKKGDGMMELSEPEPAAEEPAGASEERPLGTGELPDVQAALEAALENQQLNRSERPAGAAADAEPAEEPAVPDENGEIELAMPVYTKDELLSKAYADGLDPVVRQDRQNGVTFVDYSDCL